MVAGTRLNVTLHVICPSCLSSLFDSRTISTASLHCYSSHLSAQSSAVTWRCVSVCPQLSEFGRWDTSLGTATRLLAGRSGVGFPTGASISFYSAERSYLLWTPPSFLVNGIRDSFPRTEQPAREANLSPLSSAKLTNEWRCKSVPPICLHGDDGDTFTFTFVLPNLPLTFDSSFDAI
jgi:hypothetical protein